MGPVSMWFSVAVCGCLAVCLAAAHVRTQALQLFGAASFVFVMFWVSRAVSSMLWPPWSLAHYPLQDAALILLLWLTGGRSEYWKVIVSILLTVQLGFHSAYWSVWLLGGADVDFLRTYILLNNLGFAGILLALTARGVGHVLAWSGDLRGFGWLPLHGGAADHPRIAR